MPLLITIIITLRLSPGKRPSARRLSALLSSSTFSYSAPSREVGKSVTFSSAPCFMDGTKHGSLVGEAEREEKEEEAATPHSLLLSFSRTLFLLLDPAWP